MTNVNPDASQAHGGGNESFPSPAHPGPALHGGDKVYKNGPLFLSSKGIGWTSWKKRWFILTRTSLVFFRSDPNVAPQKGSEVNLTLGGIDLNSSGSVVVKEDKKLLTVLFPDGRDGRDGRAFTLKAETLEDLYEWKAALEEALSKAPNGANTVGQNGILNEQPNAGDGSSEQSKDRPAAKSLVIGRPILLALEDIDGNPSFLEKALRFLEVNGVQTEGVLRQAADVDDVERRIREYENGKCEFSPEEDPHVIADCIKYVLRELPSSPVPASCCNALLEAYRTERSIRVNAMRTAICETFPEPNRRLLQRILMMMQTVASHKAINRMSISAVAACMAPLLLRPLLAGDCDLENDFDVGGDGSVQLLQAAAAANHAQAIIITLLEEYKSIFGEGSVDPEPYADSEESGSESEEITDDGDDDSFDDDEDDYDDDDDDDDDEDGHDDVTGDSELDLDEDLEHELSVTSSEADEHEYNKKVSGSHTSGSEPPQVDDINSCHNSSTSPPQTSILQHNSIDGAESILKQYKDDVDKQSDYSGEVPRADNSETLVSEKSSIPSHGPARSVRRPTVWGRTPAKKNLSMESIDLSSDDEAEIRRLEDLKRDLQDRVANEAKANSLLQDSLGRRKRELHERRLALQKDVSRLQEQLQKELDLRAALEAGRGISISSSIDGKIKAELEEVAQAENDVQDLYQKAEDLKQKLNKQWEQNTRIGHGQLNHGSTHQEKPKEKLKDGKVSNIAETSENLSNKNATYLDVTATDEYKKQESPSSPDKQLSEFQNTNIIRNVKPTGGSIVVSTVGTGMNRPLATGSRKSRTRGEERHPKIASELQTFDKGWNSCEPVQNLCQSSGSEHNQPLPSMGKRQEPKGQSLENYESVKNPQGRLHHGKADKGTKVEGHLERGKSESFPTPEKGRSKMAPRTYSR